MKSDHIVEIKPILFSQNINCIATNTGKKHIFKIFSLSILITGTSVHLIHGQGQDVVLLKTMNN